jgi:hypothetical protein
MGESPLSEAERASEVYGITDDRGEIGVSPSASVAKKRVKNGAVSKGVQAYKQARESKEKKSEGRRETCAASCTDDRSAVFSQQNK